MESPATLLDERAVLYFATLAGALLADAGLLVAALVLRERLRRAAGPAIAAVALHAAVTALASVLHYASARSEAARFGAESLAVGLFNIGSAGMSVIHLGGSFTLGLLFIALLRLAPPAPPGSP